MNYEYARVSLSQERGQSQGQYIFSDNGHVSIEANFRMECFLIPFYIQFVLKLKNSSLSIYNEANILVQLKKALDWDQ